MHCNAGLGNAKVSTSPNGAVVDVCRCDLTMVTPVGLPQLEGAMECRAQSQFSTPVSEACDWFVYTLIVYEIIAGKELALWVLLTALAKCNRHGIR